MDYFQVLTMMNANVNRWMVPREPVQSKEEIGGENANFSWGKKSVLYDTNTNGGYIVT